MTNPIVMLHGAFCGGWAFDEFRAPFEERGYTVVAPSLRWHDCGREPPSALGTTSLADYADDLLALAADFDEPPILIGHSLGGLLAQMIAARTAVRAAVLIAPCAPWGVPPSTLFEMASAQALFWAGDFWARPLKPDYGIACANSLDKIPRAARAGVFERFVPESGLATFEVLHWALDARRAAHVPAAKLTCPVLCLAGSEDRINPPSTVRRIAERYNGRATFEELTGHSHWPIGEPGWEKVAARALAWLDRTLKKSSRKKEERGKLARIS
jgi:pimeloyl-ACP methyl ester carboxylesterase